MVNKDSRKILWFRNDTTLAAEWQSIPLIKHRLHVKKSLCNIDKSLTEITTSVIDNHLNSHRSSVQWGKNGEMTNFNHQFLLFK